MGYLLDGQEGRLSEEEFQILSDAANCLIYDGGKRDEMLRVFFNQVLNECKKAGCDSRALLIAIRDELQARIDSPQTPGEYLKLFPDSTPAQERAHCANCGNLLEPDEGHKSKIYPGLICDSCYDLEK